MTAEEKRSVKQEMAEEMEQLDGYTSDSVQFDGLSLGNLSDKSCQLDLTNRGFLVGAPWLLRSCR